MSVDVVERKPGRLAGISNVRYSVVICANLHHEDIIADNGAREDTIGNNP